MNQQPVIYVQKERNGCLWALAAVGLLAIVAFLWMLWGTMNIAADVNRVPAVFEQAAQTMEPSNDQPGVIILATSTPFSTAVPAATKTPAPTRPAIDQLPQGEGPYTVDQMQICRDVWAQSLQGELNTYQFGYCKGVVER